MQALRRQRANYPHYAKQNDRHEHRLCRCPSRRSDFALHKQNVCYSRSKCIFTILILRIHRNTRQQHLPHGVGHARNARSLAQQITPSLYPGEDGHLLLGHHVLGHKVHATCCRVRRYQLGY